MVMKQRSEQWGQRLPSQTQRAKSVCMFPHPQTHIPERAACDFLMTELGPPGSHSQKDLALSRNCIYISQMSMSFIRAAVGKWASSASAKRSCCQLASLQTDMHRAGEQGLCRVWSLRNNLGCCNQRRGSQ